MEGTPPQEQPAVADEQQQPQPPAAPVQPTEPQTQPAEPAEQVPTPEVQQHVDVPCAGCGQVYGFDIKPETATFTFMCRKCGTRSEWVRA